MNSMEGVKAGNQTTAVYLSGFINVDWLNNTSQSVIIGAQSTRNMY